MIFFSNKIFFFFLALAIPSAALADGTGHSAEYRSYAQQYAEKVAADELSAASIGVLALDAEGDTIVSLNPDRLLMPASNMKLVTTGLALDRLGGDFRFVTRIGYTGEIIDSTLSGDVYIMGGGDPTIASDDSIAASLPELFGEWERILECAGIRRIEGHIVGDDRFFGDIMPEEQSWQWDDCGTYYGAGISGLSFFENKQDFKAAAGDSEGDPVKIEEDFPVCGWMTYRNESQTGAPGTGDRLYYYTSDLAPTGIMRGTLGAGISSRTLECSNKFPAYTCASYFADWLGMKGTECTEGPADTGYFAPEDGPADVNAINEAGCTYSAELSGIARMTNHDSNNVYAETLFHILGKSVSGSGDYEQSRTALKTLLSDMGLSGYKTAIRDGSGLSRQNLLSPSFLCKFLEEMEKSVEFGNFVESLPSPGDKGTMETVMSDHDMSLKCRIRLKSGSMTGVKCFSGYIFPGNASEYSGRPQEKPIVFSIMINNSLLSQYRMQKIADRLIFLISAGRQD